MSDAQVWWMLVGFVVTIPGAFVVWFQTTRGDKA